MKYFDGTEVALGDLVSVIVPSGTAKARVVMLGQDYSHLSIKMEFVDWVKRDKVLKPDGIVTEWVEENPLAHNDPKYAPVGNYMFNPLDEFVIPIRDNKPESSE